MKKKLLLLSLIALCSTSIANANPMCGDGNCPPPPPGCCGGPCGCHKDHGCPPPMGKCNIEEKLKLTPEQKAKAKEFRMEAREQMRPIMDSIRNKEELKEIIKHNQALTAQAQCEQVEKLNNQISELRKQAHDIRLKNEKNFESILTQKQKAQLEKIKEQAKKDMAKKGPKPPRK